jgi:hypothetical protein
MTQDALKPNTFCIACGYDLAGLQESAVCPECANPCIAAVEYKRTREQEHDPAQAISSGLTKLLSSYRVVLIASGIAIVLSIFRQQNDSVGHVAIFIVLIAIVGVAFDFTTGIIALVTAYPSYKDPSKPCISPKLIACTMAIGVVSVFPLMFFLDSYVLTAAFVSALPFAFFLLTLAIARVLHNAALHLEVAGLRVITATTLALACLSIVSTLSSALAYEYASDMYFTAKPLGFTGGQWQDLLYLSVATLVLTHFLLVLYFWVKLRKQLEIS